MPKNRLRVGHLKTLLEGRNDDILVTIRVMDPDGCDVRTAHVSVCGEAPGETELFEFILDGIDNEYDYDDSVGHAEEQEDETN